MSNRSKKFIRRTIGFAARAGGDDRGGAAAGAVEHFSRRHVFSGAMAIRALRRRDRGGCEPPGLCRRRQAGAFAARLSRAGHGQPHRRADTETVGARERERSPERDEPVRPESRVELQYQPQHQSLARRAAGRRRREQPAAKRRVHLQPNARHRHELSGRFHGREEFEQQLVSHLQPFDPRHAAVQPHPAVAAQPRPRHSAHSYPDRRLAARPDQSPGAAARDRHRLASREPLLAGGLQSREPQGAGKQPRIAPTIS